MCVCVCVWGEGGGGGKGREGMGRRAWFEERVEGMFGYAPRVFWAVSAVVAVMA